jgi:hypothetical protein
MLEAVKDYLAYNRFSVLAYITLMVHLFGGVLATAVTAILKASESGKFYCILDPKSTTAYKSQVEKTCLTSYEETYNLPLPLYAFVLLSVSCTVLVSFVYSLAVGKHIEAVEKGDAIPVGRTDDEHGFYVFRFYFFHLVLRSVFAFLSIVLQYTVFYPHGFHSEFNCDLPTTDTIFQRTTAKSGGINVSPNTTSCENPTASGKMMCGIFLLILNIAFVLGTLVEVIRVGRKKFTHHAWNSDTQFINEHLLRKHEYTSVSGSPDTGNTLRRGQS